MSLLNYLFISSSFYWLLSCAAIYQNTQNCNSSSCILPDCYCPSFNIPGNLTLNQTPQFIFFTLDDSMYVEDFRRMKNYSWIFKNPDIRDSLNCTIKPSWYVLEKWSDYNFINYMSKIGDINLHTHTHSTSCSTTGTTWLKEQSMLMKDFPLLAQVPNCTIRGSRAPYLITNDAYFTTLQNLGIKYDTSMTYSYSKMKNVYWPFTLDFGVPDPSLCNYFADYSCPSSLCCPTKAFPGLWEVPIIEFDYYNKGNCMDPEFSDYASYLRLLKDNFMDTYKSNKAPRGFYWHWRYFSLDGNFGLLLPKDSDPLNNTRVKLFTDFYKWIVTSFPDIIFATERQVLEWMKNPVDFETTKKMPMFQACPNINLDPDSICVGGQTECYPSSEEEYYIVCGSECPSQYPKFGSTFNFSAGYTNYLGECKTFDNILVGTGGYKVNQSLTNGSSSGSSNRSSKQLSEVFVNGSSNQSNSGNINQITWNGIITPIFGSTEYGGSNNKIIDWYCATFTLKNSGTKIAKGAIITFKSCPNSRFFDIWGYPINLYNNSNTFQMLIANISIDVGITISLGGWCMDTNLDGLNSYKFPNSFRFGVDLYDSEPKCTLPNCIVHCGNGKVDSDENAQNCEIDVNPLSCISRRFLEV